MSHDQTTAKNDDWQLAHTLAAHILAHVHRVLGTKAECDCEIGSQCKRAACCYYRLTVPTNVRSTMVPLTEVERLRAAVEYCRPRLAQAAFRLTLDGILHVDKDESIP